MIRFSVCRQGREEGQADAVIQARSGDGGIQQGIQVVACDGASEGSRI